MDALFPLLFALPFLIVLTIIGVTIAVWLWGLIDVLQVPADVFFRSGSKVLWAVLIGVLGPIAAIVYLAAGRPDAATRAWMVQQRHAGVDLRAYRVYDAPSPFAGGWAPQRPPPWPTTPAPPQAGPG